MEARPRTGRRPELLPQVPIVAEETTAAWDEGSVLPPATCASRALYVGEAGARNWLDVVNEPGYPLHDPNFFNLRNNRLKAIRGSCAATFVSLGPGDGIHDVDLVASLQDPAKSASETSEQEPTLKYIPVDLSRGLLELAVRNLQPHVDVPVGILCDFEDQQPFLARQLVAYGRPPFLFSLLGGTVGNLDGGEQAFFGRFRGLVQVGDALLLDLPLAGPGWNAADEPRLRVEAYSHAFRRFVIAGVARQFPGQRGDLPEQAADVASAFAERIQLNLEHDDSTGAEVVSIRDRQSSHTVLVLRRYRWESMLRWFGEHGFRVAFAECSLASDQDKFGMGVVLLTSV